MRLELSLYTAWLALAVGSLIVTLALGYLAVLDERLRGFRAVAASYGLHSLRFIVVLALPALGSAAMPLHDALHLLASAFMAIGALRLAGAARDRRWPILLVAVAAAIWGPAAGALGLPAIAATLSTTPLTAAAQLLFAAALLRLARGRGHAGFRAVALIAGLHGLHKLWTGFGPFAPSLQFWSTILGGTLYIATAVGLIIAAQRTQFLAARAAQRDVERSEARLRSILARMPFGVAITSRDEGRFRFVNATWEHDTGRHAAEALGRTAQELGFWDSDEARRARLAAALERGEPVQLELRVPSVGGAARDVVRTMTPIEFDGEACLLSVAQDVTDLTEARRHAREDMERVAKTFAVSPVPMLISALADGTHLEVNEAWERYSGYARSEAIGRSPVQLDIWVDLADRASIIAALREGRPVRNMPCRQRRRSGEIADILFSAENIEWHGTRALIAAFQDVTALESARRQAQDSSALFEQTLALNPVPMAVASLEDGRHLFVNDAWIALTGVTRERAIGRSAAELGHWADPRARDAVVRALRAGRSVRNLPVSFARPDGTPAELLYSAAAIDWRGTPALIGIGQDVTALNRAFEEIRQLNASLDEKVRARTAELEQTMRELESFSYSISHDLRAPLRHIAGYTSLLGRNATVRSDTDATQLALRAGQAATRLGTLIDELLEYSRLARKPLALEDVALGPMVAAIIEELAPQGLERRLRWDIAVLPMVRADPTLIRLVFQNLLDNALKYTRREATAEIRIAAHAMADAIAIEVCDNGVGFDMAYAGKLFGVFQRLHADAEFEGTGIGLAHVKRIVERHGGSITAEARPGRGATFRFTLPRLAQAASAKDAAPAAQDLPQP